MARIIVTPLACLLVKFIGFGIVQRYTFAQFVTKCQAETKSLISVLGIPIAAASLVEFRLFDISPIERIHRFDIVGLLFGRLLDGGIDPGVRLGIDADDFLFRQYKRRGFVEMSVARHVPDRAIEKIFLRMSEIDDIGTALLDRLPVDLDRPAGKSQR